MKWKGKIQLNFFKATPTTNESYRIVLFSGFFDFVFKIVKAYKSGCDKFYVFIEK